MGLESGFSALCDVVSILQLCDCYTFNVELGSVLIMMIVSVLMSTEANGPDTSLVASLISKTHISHASISGNFH